jgi:hypothetical protein
LLFLKLLSDVGVPALDETVHLLVILLALSLLLSSSFLFHGVPAVAGLCRHPPAVAGFWWSPYSCPALGAVLTVAGIPILKCLCSFCFC